VLMTSRGGNVEFTYRTAGASFRRRFTPDAATGLNGHAVRIQLCRVHRVTYRADTEEDRVLGGPSDWLADCGDNWRRRR